MESIRILFEEGADVGPRGVRMERSSMDKRNAKLLERQRKEDDYKVKLTPVVDLVGSRHE